MGKDAARSLVSSLLLVLQPNGHAGVFGRLGRAYCLPRTPREHIHARLKAANSTLPILGIGLPLASSVALGPGWVLLLSDS